MKRVGSLVLGLVLLGISVALFGVLIPILSSLEGSHDTTMVMGTVISLMLPAGILLASVSFIKFSITRKGLFADD